MTEDDIITAALRAEHLDDDGFTDRVLATLPARRRRFTARDRVIAAASVAAAAAGAFACVHSSVFVSVLPLAAIAALGFWGALASADA
jgi:hypothetical protein